MKLKLKHNDNIHTKLIIYFMPIYIETYTPQAAAARFGGQETGRNYRNPSKIKVVLQAPLLKDDLI